MANRIEGAGDFSTCASNFFSTQKKKSGTNLFRFVSDLITSFVVVLLDGLLEGRDVPEGEQEEDDQVALVLDGCYLQ
jgi:hypothetical protein